MSNTLEELYESTAEEFRYGIGTIGLPEFGVVPIIQLHYADWGREKLLVVREAFRQGLILVSGHRPTGQIDLYVSTRETITLQDQAQLQADVLRAPAWDAHLAKVDAVVAGQFEAERQRFGGFLLLVGCPAGEFLTGVDERREQTIVGAVLDRVLPPSGSFGGEHFS
jgi:hypothetical protein